MSSEMFKKIEEFSNVFKDDLKQGSEHALQVLKEIIIYCEGINDNEKNPITKAMNNNTLLSLYVFKGVLEVAFGIKRTFQDIEPKLNSFEERITKLQKKIDDMEKGR